MPEKWRKVEKGKTAESAEICRQSQKSSVKSIKVQKNPQ
jgi:hypothetical protein